jgi:hypothetical protein
MAAKHAAGSPSAQRDAAARVRTSAFAVRALAAGRAAVTPGDATEGIEEFEGSKVPKELIQAVQMRIAPKPPCQKRCATACGVMGAGKAGRVGLSWGCCPE